MTIKKNNGIGFFRTMLPTMLVFSIMANGARAVDGTPNNDDNRKAPKKVKLLGYDPQKAKDELDQMLVHWTTPEEREMMDKEVLAYQSQRRQTNNKQ
jgi:hypothetical protein